MGQVWYYVNNNERNGPIEEKDLQRLFKENVIKQDCYIWTRGFQDWVKLCEVGELNYIITENISVEKDDPVEDIPTVTEKPENEKRSLEWDQISYDNQIFSIKIGLDRGGAETEYGPFSLNQLKKAYTEKRVNGKTFVFTPGMENWTFLADLPIFEQLFSEMPPVIEENEQRSNTRKPFVARIFFHDNSVIYEGICRDVSIGGLQVLVANFPGQAGNNIAMNVHPENSSYHFVAKGKIARILDGNQGFSLRFSDLSNEALQAIQSYIERSNPS